MGRLVNESRMIRMIGLIILNVQIVILMTRMIAQNMQKHEGKYRKPPPGRGRAPQGRGRRPRLVFLNFP